MVNIVEYRIEMLELSTLGVSKFPYIKLSMYRIFDTSDLRCIGLAIYRTSDISNFRYIELPIYRVERVLPSIRCHLPVVYAGTELKSFHVSNIELLWI